MEQPPFALGDNPSAVAMPPTQPEPTAPVILVYDDQDVPPNGVWMQVDMPSMGLAGYPAKLWVRKFGVPDLARLGAARKLNSYSHTVSAIGQTVHKIPVGLLTPGDFDYLMSWHEINSLAKTPKKVRWQSRYGHTNDLTIDQYTRQTINIENISRVLELQAQGYDFPRVGDELWRLHMVDAEQFNEPDNETEFGLATFAKVDDPTDFPSKLAKIRAMTDNLDFYEGLDEWRTVANHGVKTTVNLTCGKFDPLTAIEDIKRSLAMMDAAMSVGEFDEISQEQVQSLLTELSHLTKLASANQLANATPVQEEVIVPLDVNNFFPYVL